MAKTTPTALAIGAAAALGAAIFAASPNFVPDYVFKGSALTGWQKLGGGEWRAENGEIIASPAESGGWLMLDKSFQDVQIYTSLQCAGACKPGVLLRAEMLDKFATTRTDGARPHWSAPPFVRRQAARSRRLCRSLTKRISAGAKKQSA